MNIEDKTVKFIKSIHFFSSFHESDIEAIISAGNIKKYDKNSILYLQDDKADKFYVILNGWIKIYTQLQDGEESVISLFSRGNIFGELAILSDGIYHNCAQTIEESKILEIPTIVIRNMIQDNPDIAINMLSIMASHINEMEGQIEHLTMMNAPQRVGCFLLKLCVPQVKGRTTIQLPYDKFLIAAKLGMQPETFSRALKSLRDIGVSIKGDTATIEEIADLQKYSCVKCSNTSECTFSAKCDCEQKLCSEKTI